MSKEKEIAVSGATSFTGLWICEAFKNAGWEVQAPVKSAEAEYEGIKALRVELLNDFANIEYEIDVTQKVVLEWIQFNNPKIWIHHHHWMENFRKNDYDLKAMKRICLDPLPALVSTLKKSGCKGIIYSGSVFEDPKVSTTPYAQSKARVWEDLKELAKAEGLLLSKVVIPNPVGPLENADRLVPALIHASKKRETFNIQAPDHLIPNIPVRLLATEYVKVATALLDGREEVCVPEPWTVKLRDWIDLVQDEFIRAKLKLKPCAMSLESRMSPLSKSPESRIWGPEWDHYAQVLKSFNFYYE